MRFFFRRKSSKEIAKDRLKILLISDRVNCYDKGRYCKGHFQIHEDRCKKHGNPDKQNRDEGRTREKDSHTLCQHSHSGYQSIRERTENVTKLPVTGL